MDSDDDANDDDSASLNVYAISKDYDDTTKNNQKQYFSHQLSFRTDQSLRSMLYEQHFLLIRISTIKHSASQNKIQVLIL